MKKPPMQRIIRVAVLPPLKLVLEFEDGRVVVADLTQLAAKGGVFARLRDEKYFKKVKLANGGRSVAWPNRLDFCADALYVSQAKIRRHKPTINAFGAQIFVPAAEVVAA